MSNVVQLMVTTNQRWFKFNHEQKKYILLQGQKAFKAFRENIHHFILKDRSDKPYELRKMQVFFELGKNRGMAHFHASLISDSFLLYDQAKIKKFFDEYFKGVTIGCGVFLKKLPNRARQLQNYVQKDGNEILL